ncbi:rRNA (cytosine-C5-)-methyltransferase RCM1 [Aspergillus foveolatus]|uniref:rRNA (cytosine-C5-)-methyltransferase RCM1 n=1 Tax=Aspergillus foveolatus TaxID=210207 RepID=UPI003CCCFDD0
MSLYYDAVSILTTPSSAGGSFKSRLYNSRNLKASPAQVYALITEAAKWDILLKEVIDQAGILKLEPKVVPHHRPVLLTPLLALLLVHDHLLAKNGIAAPASHPLRQAVERHKIRLKGEFTKARVRRTCATIPELKEAVRKEKLAALGAKGSSSAVYPRWVRVNNVLTTMEAQLKTTFAAFENVESLDGLVVGGDDKQKRMRLDPHIPDLVAVAPGVEFSSTPAYKNGEIILQDKASCFPAYLLLGDDWVGQGDLVDGCAAPGNKTTHMASLLCKARSKKKAESSRIISMDASSIRAKILKKMVSIAGADSFTTVLQGQDFLALDPQDPRFRDVTGLILDPSCSGSGIIGRDDVPQLVLPAPGRHTPASGSKNQTQGKKRKRNDSSGTSSNQLPTSSSSTSAATPSTSENDTPISEITQDRLLKLSNLQFRIVTHALTFPAARKVTYSTCSIHLLENEAVVQRILESDIAKRRGWRVLRRDEQPEGLKRWKHRGVKREEPSGGGAIEGGEVNLSDEELEGCLRCWPGDEEGTGGFFVVGFVREGDDDGFGTTVDGENESEGQNNIEKENEDEDEEWEGFSD